MKRLSFLMIFAAMFMMITVFTFSDHSGVTFNKYTTHYYYQIEPNGEWYWNDTIEDKVPDDFHGDIDSYLDYIGYDYMGNMVRLCGDPIYVSTEHSH